MTKSLPKMARAASDPGLADAFNQHLEETKGQVARVDQIVELTGLKLKRIKCVAMEDLIVIVRRTPSTAAAWIRRRRGDEAVRSQLATADHRSRAWQCVG